jgi:hypothetical protein
MNNANSSSQRATVPNSVLIAVVASLIYALLIVIVKGDSLALVTVGTRFDPTVFNTTDEGYDGQFNFFIARDPAGAAAFITQGEDFPAYRFQRILLPALSWLLSLGGQVPLIPWALLLINLFGLGLGTWALSQILIEQRVSPWYSLGWALSLSGLASVRLSLAEPLAYGLTAFGLWMLTQKRWWWSAVIFALAALAKETTLLLATGAGLWMLWQSISDTEQRAEWMRRAVVFGLITLLPFVLWQLYLRSWLGEFGIGSGGRLATPFEIIPFGGVLRILTEGTTSIFVIMLATLIPFVLLPTIWGLWSSIRDFVARRIDLFSVVLFVTCAVMPFVPFSTYREPLGIFRFIAGLQIALIAYSGSRRLRRPLRYSLLWILTTLFVIMSDFSPSSP